MNFKVSTTVEIAVMTENWTWDVLNMKHITHSTTMFRVTHY